MSVRELEKINLRWGIRESFPGISAEAAKRRERFQTKQHECEEIFRKRESMFEQSEREENQHCSEPE